jgi:hypothetical protein
LDPTATDIQGVRYGLKLHVGIEACDQKGNRQGDARPPATFCQFTFETIIALHIHVSLVLHMMNFNVNQRCLPPPEASPALEALTWWRSMVDGVPASAMTFSSC